MSAAIEAGRVPVEVDGGLGECATGRRHAVRILVKPANTRPLTKLGSELILAVLHGLPISAISSIPGFPHVPPSTISTHTYTTHLTRTHVHTHPGALLNPDVTGRVVEATGVTATRSLVLPS